MHVWAYYDQTGSPQYLTLDRVDNNNDTLTGSLSVQSNNVTILSGAFASVAEFVSSITLHAPGGSLSAVLQINTTRNWTYDPGSDRFDLATTQTLSVTRSGLPDINETTNGFQNDVGVNFIADTESGGIPGNPSPNVKPEPLNLKQRFQMELFQESEYVKLPLRRT